MFITNASALENWWVLCCMSVIPKLEGGDQPWLHSKFKTSLGYTRLHFKIERKRKKDNNNKIYSALSREAVITHKME